MRWSRAPPWVGLQLAVLFGLLATISAAGLSGIGPYLIYQESISDCGDSKGKIRLAISKVSKFDIKKPFVLQTVTGTMNLSTLFNDKIWLKLNFASRSQGQWKPNALVFDFKDKGCSIIRTHAPDLFRVMFMGSGPARGECSVQPGNFIYDNEAINWTFPKFPVLPYGDYKIHALMGNGQESQGCNIIHEHIIPVPKKY